MGLGLLTKLKDEHGGKGGLYVDDYRLTLMHDGSNAKLELRADAARDVADASATRFDDSNMRGSLTSSTTHVGLAGHVDSPGAANPSCSSAKANAIGDS